ncbi:MAG: dienelactone hydrolase family protein [Planctomycetaceae bacterium]|nr:dienelactone hydrolase family protein [Planctomycetaceae bacterium]
MIRKFPIALATAILALASPAAHAALATQTVAYAHQQTQMQGLLVLDDAAPTPQPLVLVVHEWWGLNDYARNRARQLAQMGYAAFAVDMYGKGVVAKTRDEAAKLAGPLRSDRKLMRARIKAALDAVSKNPRVDAKRIAVIGYCFGGTVALELARSGADIAGVVSFHGGLDTPTPQDARSIKAKILVCTGADDRSVPMTQVQGFIEEMRPAKVNYQINIYSGAVHAFTNPASGDDPSTNVAYNETADKRSWEAMKNFFDEIFKR